MGIEIEVDGEDGFPQEEVVAMASLGAVMALLERAVREDDGERYVELVTAAHDLGDHIFKSLQGIDRPLKMATRAVIASVGGVVLQ